MNYKKSILKVSGIALLAIDLLFYLLALNNLYVFSTSISIYFCLFIIHFVYLYISLISIIRTIAFKVLWGVISPFFLITIAIVGWLALFHTNKVDYYNLSSPNNTQTLVIEYSNWSLGETNHYYDFYKQTGFPLVKKRLNEKPLHVITRGTNMRDVNILGAQNAQWKNEKTVTFTSPYLNEEVTLSLK